MDITNLIGSLVSKALEAFFDFFNIEAILSVLRNIGNTLAQADFFIHAYRIPGLVSILALLLFLFNLLYHVYLVMGGRASWTKVIVRMGLTAIALAFFLTPGAPCVAGDYPCQPSGKVYEDILPAETIEVEKGGQYDISVDNGRITLVPRGDESVLKVNLPQRRVYYFEPEFEGALGTKALLGLLNTTASAGQRLFYAELYRYQDAIKETKEALIKLTTVIFQTQLMGSILKSAVVSGLGSAIPGAKIFKGTQKTLFDKIFKGKVPEALRGAGGVLGGAVDSARLAVVKALFSFAEILAALPFALITFFSLTFWSLVLAGKFAIYTAPLFLAIAPLFPGAASGFVKRLAFLVVFPFLLGAVFAVSTKLLFFASFDKLFRDLREVKGDVEQLELYKESPKALAAVAALEISRRQLLNTLGCLKNQFPENISCHGMNELLSADPEADPLDFAYRVAVAFSGGAQDPEGKLGWSRDGSKLQRHTGEDGKEYLLPERLYIPVVYGNNGVVHPLPLSSAHKDPIKDAPPSLEQFVNDNKAQGEDHVSPFGEPVMSAYFTRLASEILATQDADRRKDLAKHLHGEISSFLKELEKETGRLVGAQVATSLMDDASLVFGFGFRWELGFPYTPHEVAKVLENASEASLAYFSKGGLRELGSNLEKLLSEIPDVSRSIWQNPEKVDRYSLFARERMRKFLEGGDFRPGSPMKLNPSGQGIPFAPREQRNMEHVGIQAYFLKYYFEFSNQALKPEGERSVPYAITMYPGQVYDPDYQKRLGFCCHRGIDLVFKPYSSGDVTRQNTPPIIYWPFGPASVTFAGSDGLYGNMVRAKIDGSPCEVIFAHLHDIMVRARDALQPGTPIGRMGGTPFQPDGSYTWKPHLHLEPVCETPASQDPARTDPDEFFRVIASWAPSRKADLNPASYPAVNRYRMDEAKMAPFAPYLYLDALYMMESVAVSNIDQVLAMASKKGALLFFFLVTAVLALTVGRMTAQAIEGVTQFLSGAESAFNFGERLAGQVAFTQAYLIPTERLTAPPRPLRTAGLPPAYTPALAIEKVEEALFLPPKRENASEEENASVKKDELTPAQLLKETLTRNSGEESFLRDLLDGEAEYADRLSAALVAISRQAGSDREKLDTWLYGKEPPPPFLEGKYQAWLDEVQRLEKELKEMSRLGASDPLSSEQAFLKRTMENFAGVLDHLVLKTLRSLGFAVRGAVQSVTPLGNEKSPLLVTVTAMEGTDKIRRGILEVYKTGAYAFMPESFKEGRVTEYRGEDALKRLAEISQKASAPLPPEVEELLRMRGEGGKAIGALRLVETNLPGSRPLLVLSQDVDQLLSQKGTSSEDLRQELRALGEASSKLAEKLAQVLAHEEKKLGQVLAHEEEKLGQALAHKEERKGAQRPHSVSDLLLAFTFAKHPSVDALRGATGKPTGGSEKGETRTSSEKTVPGRLKDLVKNLSASQQAPNVETLVAGLGEKEKELLEKLPSVNRLLMNPSEVVMEVRRFSARSRGEGLFAHHSAVIGVLGEDVRSVKGFLDLYDRLSDEERGSFTATIAKVRNSLPGLERVPENEGQKAVENAIEELRKLTTLYDQYVQAFERVADRLRVLKEELPLRGRAKEAPSLPLEDPAFSEFGETEVSEGEEEANG